MNLLNLPDYDISRVEQSAREYRFRADTLADLDAITQHLSRQALGSNITRSDAARLAIATLAEKIRSGKPLGIPVNPHNPE